MKISQSLYRNAEWILAILVLLLGVSVAFRSQTAIIRFYSTDDAYYYFVPARNAVQGNGISFDGIARGNGYHPLWMLICLPVFTLSGISPWLPLRVLVVIHSLLHAAAGLVLFRTLHLHLSRAVSLVLMAVWLFSISIYNVAGMNGLESGLNAFCLILLLYAVVRWENGVPVLGPRWGIWLLGVFSALALLARLDNIFLVGLMGLWVVLKDNPVDRRLLAVDIAAAAISVMGSYFARFRFSDSFYNMMEAIKFMVALSVVILPGMLVLLGGSRLQWVRGGKFVPTWLRLGLGTVAGSLLVTLITLLRFGNSGYSRLLFAVQWAVFALMALGFRLIVRWLGRKQTAVVDHWRLLRKQDWPHWQQLIGRGLAYFAPLTGTLAAFLAFNHFYFGAMMPISGKIKAWWGTIDTIYGQRAGNYLRFLGLHQGGPYGFLTDPIHRAAEWLDAIIDAPSNLFFYLCFSGLVVAFLLMWRKNRHLQSNINRYAWMPFALAVLFHSSNYMMTGYVGFRDWYWLPESLLLLVTVGLVLDIAITRRVGDEIAQRWVAWIAVLVVGTIVIRFAFWHFSYFPFIQTSPPATIEEVSYLMDVTEPGSVIGMTGSGEFGYFTKDRVIVNLDGLINGVDYFDHLQSRTVSTYLDEIGMDYILGKPHILFESPPYRGNFNERLAEIVPIGEYILYRYSPDS